VLAASFQRRRLAVSQASRRDAVSTLPNSELWFRRGRIIDGVLAGVSVNVWNAKRRFRNASGYEYELMILQNCLANEAIKSTNIDAVAQLYFDLSRASSQFQFSVDVQKGSRVQRTTY
jgi:hypothetical protein